MQLQPSFDSERDGSAAQWAGRRRSTFPLATGRKAFGSSCALFSCKGLGPRPYANKTQLATFLNGGPEDLAEYSHKNILQKLAHQCLMKMDQWQMKMDQPVLQTHQ